MNGITINSLQYKPNQKRICPSEEVFDAIHDAHDSIGHKRIASTKNKLSEVYCNITEKSIKLCIDICPICNLSNDNKRTKHKGLGVSIKSKGFRERIQVDLIDYQSDPQKNHNDVEMNWLMVVKDHFTKFMWLRPLRKKQGILVAAELRLLFHEIGFPLIFHSDNGREFINNEVYTLIKTADPNIITVRGAPRTPRHQGSVENGNQHIKNIIDKQLEILRTKNTKSNPGWIDILGPVTSAINSSVCYRNNKLTPYRHVFTQDFELPFNIPHHHKNKLLTVKALDRYVNDPILSERLQELGFTENIITNNTDFPSQTSIVDTNHTVTNDNAEILSKGSSNSNQNEQFEIFDVSTDLNTTKEQSSYTSVQHIVRRKFMRPIFDVLSDDPNKRTLINVDKTFNFVHASIVDCKKKIVDSIVIDPSINYSIGSIQYYMYCFTDKDRYWENDLLSLFATLESISSSKIILDI